MGTWIRTQTRCPNFWPEGDAILQYEMYRPGRDGAVNSTAMSSCSFTGKPLAGICKNKKIELENRDCHAQNRTKRKFIGLIAMTARVIVTSVKKIKISQSELIAIFERRAKNI